MNLKNLVLRYKYKVMLTLLIMALFFIIGCGAATTGAPPSGPVGGGCGY